MDDKGGLAPFTSEGFWSKKWGIGLHENVLYWDFTTDRSDLVDFFKG